MNEPLTFRLCNHINAVRSGSVAGCSVAGCSVLTPRRLGCLTADGKKRKMSWPQEWFSWSGIEPRGSAYPSINPTHLQVFHYTCCITPKRVTSWRGPSPRHCAQAAQLHSKKCCSGGELLATLCPIWLGRDLNLRPLAPETNALPLDLLAGPEASIVAE